VEEIERNMWFLRKLSNKIVKIIPENTGAYRMLTLFGLILTSKSRLAKKSSLRIEVPLAEHCNLNCKYCCSFSPLADELYYEIEGLKNDLHKLSDVTHGHVDVLNLVGGEPLLHKEIDEAMKLCRTYFPKTRITIITNGILLNNRPDTFWKTCNENNIAVKITRYPIRLDYNSLKSIAEKFNVDFGYWGTDDEPVKTMWKTPFDMSGTQSIKTSWKICREANYCARLKDAKIYKCNTIPCAAHFNKYFNKQLEITNGDFLELDAIADIDEIYDFLHTPASFCKYCNRKDISTGLKWGVSPKTIEEWV
jgi:MoaA/NifB/PqqE/SkfB family radical SAM enzyme